MLGKIALFSLLWCTKMKTMFLTRGLQIENELFSRKSFFYSCNLENKTKIFNYINRIPS